jgi:hypothetical protein
MLINFKKIFNRLIINYAFKFKKTKVFIILRAYFNNKASVKANIISYRIIVYIKGITLKVSIISL